MAIAPAGTPKPILDKLNASLKQALESPALKERMVKEGFDPTTSTPEEARARLEKELPQWAKLIKERGITAE
jgi:tripartite-type tricarboxylate transporter receptor subunit TctC